MHPSMILSVIHHRIIAVFPSITHVPSNFEHPPMISFPIGQDDRWINGNMSLSYVSKQCENKNALE